jgi:lipid II:glycine glycyltransferase (peptidoglycan interpeptide bridge formation enzyme)
MQPKEIFVIDITKLEEQLLAEMKNKTRYNIRLSQKQGVCVKVISNSPNYLISNDPPAGGSNPNDQNVKNKYLEEFLKLTEEMAKRQGIKTHTAGYYKKMFEVLPEEMVKIYAAEYDGKIIAANLMLFFGETAVYLHGASSNEHRNVMAPYLLQWQAILDAKELGYKFYDFGGVKTVISHQSSIISKNEWQGITKFKIGFSPSTTPVVFPGSYDIIISPVRYWIYRLMQMIKSIFS